MAKTGLTDKQKKFCEAYVLVNDMDAGQSLLDAGYTFGGNERTQAQNKLHRANELLSSKKVQSYIDELRQRYTSDYVVDEMYVIKKLKNIAETGSNENVQLKALELLGKSRSMFTDKQVLTSDTDAASIIQGNFAERMKKFKVVNGGEEDETNID